MSQPDFFILGTAKSGTTACYHYLRRHPQVCLSQPKETWFFDGLRYNRGLDHYWETHFAPFLSGDIVETAGEVASSYLYVPYVAERLAQSAPQARLLAILRHPVERAFSDWWMLWQQGIETLPFEAALADNLRRLENGPVFDSAESWQEHLDSIRQRRSLKYRTYLDYGYYEVQIRRYLQFFPAGQLKILLFDDLRRDPAAFYCELLAFLGLECPDEPEPFTPRNVAVPSRSIGRVISYLSRGRFALLLPSWSKRLANEAFLRIGRQTKLEPYTRAALLEHYSGHNQKLSTLLGRELSDWQC